MTLRALLFLMGVLSVRAYAGDPALKDELVTALGGQCPKATIQADGGGRCVEGEAGCLDDERGRQALSLLKRGCEEGRGGEGNPCLYGLFIRKDGKAVAVCGPRMLRAQK